MRHAVLGIDVGTSACKAVAFTLDGARVAESRASVAHMDEVGLVVRAVRPDGFPLVDRVGGIGRRSLPGSVIRLLGEHGPVVGVVGVLSHHLTPADAYYTIPSVEALYVDVGATSDGEVADAGIGVGTRATFATSLERLGTDSVAAKALDDRALCYVLVALARLVDGEEGRRALRLIGTVREEFDLAGSAHLAQSLAGPSIVLDISPAHDTPDAAGAGPVLGGGPILKHQDFHGRGPLAGCIASEEVIRAVRSAARAAGVSLQEEVQSGLVTDAASLVTSVGQERLAALSLPVRYTHSPVEVARLADLDALVRLLVECTSSL